MCPSACMTLWTSAVEAVQALSDAFATLLWMHLLAGNLLVLHAELLSACRGTELTLRLQLPTDVDMRTRFDWPLTAALCVLCLCSRYLHSRGK